MAYLALVALPLLHIGGGEPAAVPIPFGHVAQLPRGFARKPRADHFRQCQREALGLVLFQCRQDALQQLFVPHLPRRFRGQIAGWYLECRFRGQIAGWYLGRRLRGQITGIIFLRLRNTYETDILFYA